MQKPFSRFLYTFKHKLAFLKVEKRLLGKNTLSGYLHDCDKLLLYLFCFWKSAESIHNWHRKHARHHVENNIPKKQEDYIQMVIDWECARLTKRDKPLNAYETLMKFYPHKVCEIKPIIKKYLPHQLPVRERDS